MVRLYRRISSMLSRCDRRREHGSGTDSASLPRIFLSNPGAADQSWGLGVWKTTQRIALLAIMGLALWGGAIGLGASSAMAAATPEATAYDSGVEASSSTTTPDEARAIRARNRILAPEPEQLQPLQPPKEEAKEVLENIKETFKDKIPGSRPENIKNQESTDEVRDDASRPSVNDLSP